jgi:hypothetical protein
MKQYLVALLALGFLGTACKQRQFNGADAQSAQGASSTLSGKNLTVSCTDEAKTMTVAANSLQSIVKLEEAVKAGLFLRSRENPFDARMTAFDEAGYWRVQVKSNVGAFYDVWLNATFNKGTLRSLDGSTGSFSGNGEIHIVNCELKIGSAGTGSIPDGIATPRPGTGSIIEGVAPAAAKYKCLTHESTQTFLTREECARSGCPEQDCIRAQ